MFSKKNNARSKTIYLLLTNKVSKKRYI